MSQPSYSEQGVTNMFTFEFNLPMIRYVLPLTSAAIAAVGTGRGYSVGRGLDDLDQSRFGVIFLVSGDPGAHPVTGYGSFYKDHEAVAASQALTAVSHVFNMEFDHMSFA